MLKVSDVRERTLHAPAHLAVNRSDVTTIAVVARTDPREQASVVTLSLPPHLASLDAFPVAAG